MFIHVSFTFFFFRKQLIDDLFNAYDSRIPPNLDTGKYHYSLFFLLKEISYMDYSIKGNIINGLLYQRKYHK